jgi:hypothetical protein
VVERVSISIADIDFVAVGKEKLKIFLFSGISRILAGVELFNVCFFGKRSTWNRDGDTEENCLLTPDEKKSVDCCTLEETFGEV